MGDLLAQISHAAGESAHKAKTLPFDTHVVVLGVKNEEELLKIEQKLLVANIVHIPIREPDMKNSLTAIGLLPTSERKPIRKLLSNLPLLKSLGDNNETKL